MSDSEESKKEEYNKLFSSTTPYLERIEKLKEKIIELDLKSDHLKDFLESELGNYGRRETEIKQNIDTLRKDLVELYKQVNGGSKQIGVTEMIRKQNFKLYVIIAVSSVGNLEYGETLIKLLLQ